MGRGKDGRTRLSRTRRSNPLLESREVTGLGGLFPAGRARRGTHTGLKLVSGAGHTAGLTARLGSKEMGGAVYFGLEKVIQRG